MSEAQAKKTGLIADLMAFWPSLPFMAFGLWCAWSSLTYSGALWLSDSEVDGTWLSYMYIYSGIGCGAVFLAFGIWAHTWGDKLVGNPRCVLVGGALAGLGCLIIIFVGPFYLGPVVGDNNPFFVIGSIMSGAGTAVIGLRCGVLYSMLPPRRALVYAALSQLVAAFIYFAVLLSPTWAPVQHGPSLVGILAFCLLPVAASAVACVRPTGAAGIIESYYANMAASSASAPARANDLIAAAEAARRNASAAATSPKATFKANLAKLPSAFWGFMVFVVVMSVCASMIRSAIVTHHAPASTLEGNNLLMLLRVAMALAFVVFAVRPRLQVVPLGKLCSTITVFSATATACVAAFGGLNNELSLVIYFAASVFEFTVWCLLAFIAVQKRVSAVLVFGVGRGAFMLSCAAGWGVGTLLVPILPSGTPTMVFFLVIAGVMLLLSMGVFSERDYTRLFSTVSEDELSMEDLFDIERREAEAAAERRAEKRGRFSLAIEAITADHSLSAREGEVLRCLAMGYGSDRIAETMGIKVNTARAHTHNVYVKLDVHSREELMRLVDEAVARA